MGVCPFCKAEGWVAGKPCASCNRVAPELELDLPVGPTKPKVPPPKKIEQEPSLDLAVDMDFLRPSGPPSTPSGHMQAVGGGVANTSPGPTGKPSGQMQAVRPPSGQMPAVRAPSGQMPAVRPPSGQMQAVSGAPGPQRTPSGSMPVPRTSSGGMEAVGNAYMGDAPQPIGAPQVFVSVPELTTPDPQFEAIGEVEPAEYAAFGAPPKIPFLAPMYTYKVFRRRKELQEELEQRREDAKRVAKQLEEMLCAFGEQARPIAMSEAQTAKLVGDLEREEMVLRSRDQTVVQEEEKYKALMQEVDTRIAAAGQVVSDKQVLARKAQIALESAQENLKRAQARLERAEAELKGNSPGAKTGAISVSGQMQAVRPGLSGTMPAVGGAPVDWAAEKARWTEETAKYRAVFVEAEKAFNEAKARVAEAQKAKDAVVAEKNKAETEKNQRVAQRLAAADESRSEVRRILSEIARRAMPMRSVFTEVFDPLRKEIQKFTRFSEQREADVKTVEAAIDAYDKNNYNIGLGIIALGGLVLLGLFLVPKMIKPPPPQDPDYYYSPNSRDAGAN